MKLLRFEVASYPKKYYAILDDNGKIIKVAFGDQNYQQYHDKIGHYSNMDHNDPKRRILYYKRHKIDYPKYSPDYFSKK